MKRAMIRSMNFNCTIQELKQWKQIDEITEAAVFQLHHTGIKTIIHLHIGVKVE